jgi:hypothetical protein
MKLAAPNLPFFQQIVVRGVLITVGLFILAALWGIWDTGPAAKTAP